MSIADELLTIVNNTPSVCEAVKSAKTSVSGLAVSANDVSSIEHNLAVRVDSKNLIPYPYTYTTQLRNGVTLTDNGDGTITANGTATGSVFFYVSDNTITLAKGTYFLSGCPTGGTGETYSMYAVGYDNGKEVLRPWDFGNGVKFTSPIDNLVVAVIIFIRPNTTVNNLVFKPQIEKGEVATEYTPYKQGFSGVEVSRYSKNLLSTITTWTNGVNVPKLNKPIYMKKGTSYAFSFETTYTQYRLMFFGTSVDGSPLIVNEGGGSANSGVYISGAYTASTDRIQSNANISNPMIVFTCNKDFILTAMQIWNAANETNKTYSKAQLEIGGVVTAYEPYTEPQIAIANADGTVKGLISISPNMTLTTDNSGIVINCEYISQTNANMLDKYAELQNAFENAKTIVQEIRM